MATYNEGSVTEAEVEGWSEFRRSEKRNVPTATRIATVAFHEFMAEQARAEGLAEIPLVKVALQVAEARILEKALRRYLADSIEIPASELEDAVRRTQSAYYRPPRTKLRNLLIRYPEGATEDQIEATRVRIEELRERILIGESFAELAVEFSESQTRFREGKIGWMRRDDLPPELADIAFSLKPREVSQVLATGRGFTLLYCDEVDPEFRPTEAEVRQRVRKRLSSERMAALWQDIIGSAEDMERVPNPTEDPKGTIAKLANSTAIQINDAELRALLQFYGLAPPEDVDPEALEARLRHHFELKLIDQAARSRGLHRSARVANLLHWTQLTTFSNAVLSARVQHRFEPLQEKEIRDYYEEHREQFVRPAQTHLRAILIPSHVDTLPDDFARAESLATRIQLGNIAFETAAGQYSKHPSSTRGGDLGWLDLNQVAGLGPNVLETAQELNPGEISGLVQQPEGLGGLQHLWILQVNARRPAEGLPFESVTIRAENALGNERTKRVAEDIRTEVLENLDLRLLSSASVTTSSQ
jgi:parvulin-like peptidyl-prolyl isomerase